MKQSNREIKTILCILTFVLYATSTGLSIGFSLIQKNALFSTISAVLAIVFIFIFDILLPNRKVTLYKYPDETNKCIKCNETAESEKIYCKKHTYLNKFFFVLKFLTLNFLLSAGYTLFKNYHKNHAPLSGEVGLESLAVGLIAIAIYAPFYIYVRHGGRESVSSTMLDITYIETPIQEGQEEKHTRTEIIHNDVKVKSSIEPTYKKNPSKRNVKIAIVTVSVLLAVSIGFNVFLFQNSSNKERQLSEAQIEISKKQDEIKSFKWDAEYWREQRDDEEAKRYQELSKYIFLYKYAACVNENSPYYHHPSCDKFDDSSFNIYNTDLAESYGYKPCPDCW